MVSWLAAVCGWWLVAGGWSLVVDCCVEVSPVATLLIVDRSLLGSLF
jgi:hypothetical protein